MKYERIGEDKDTIEHHSGDMIIRQKYPFLAVIAVLLAVGVFMGWGRYQANISPIIQRNVERPNEITILWAEWAPADILQKLTEDFTRESGVKVTLIQHSWGTWQKIFFDEMEKKGRTYDMVIGDSQWLGRGATEGHYVELTKWLKDNSVDQSMTSASITGYAEFPKGSGHYWAIPVEGDAMGFSYRRDLFEDPGEMAAFRKHYGYRLDVPQTWDQLYDIAEFFYRPDKDLYGVLVWVEPDYDGLTMGVQSVIWAWGGQLGNTSNYKVQGILNSTESVEALRFYKKLNAYNNSDWHDYYLDTQKSSNAPMMEGKVAMAMGYFAINTELLDRQKNPYADSMGFFANPKGPVARVCSLGGQGISIISYSKKKDICFQFLQWFIREDIQRKWSQLGGLSCNKAVLSSSSFLNASPINRPFKESIEMARDFWTVPEYPALLAVSQRYWHEYIFEHKRTAKETLDAIAEEWEAIFERYGYYKE